MKNTLIKSPAISPAAVSAPCSRERFGVAPIAAAQGSGLSSSSRFAAAYVGVPAALAMEASPTPAQHGTTLTVARKDDNGIPEPRGPQR